MRRSPGINAAPQPRIGSYRLLAIIGEGGMGVVHEAVQDPLGLRVALKVIKPGLMNAEMLRRFEYEAQLLARLEHPGIARIHYAGIFDAGLGPQPYFAMELIDGQRLDEWLRENRSRLKLRQLVELFHKVCFAIQHAHSKFVVHRDLKPSNILITAEGEPKILDFGVARAINSDIQTTTLHTEVGQLVGTLPYMSPEQASGKVGEIDTSSDVYALGVIGYEIFGGRMPYALENKPLHDAVRVICEDEPSRLSSIDKSLRGDVETIVQKALEKDKIRRYHTAGDLASDVKRYLDYEPITARPPGTWYQLGRFARRNKVLVGGLVAVVLALAAGAAVSTYFAITARQQRAEAEQRRAEADAVNQFLTNDVLSGASPDLLPDKAIRDVIVKKLIQPAANRVGDRFKDNPLVEAAVRDTLAKAFCGIGLLDMALTHAERALEIRRRILGDDHRDTLSSIDTVAGILRGQSKHTEAEPMLREVLQRRRRLLGDDHPDTLTATGNLGGVLLEKRDLLEADSLLREHLERCKRVLGTEHERTMYAMHDMSGVLELRGKIAEAEVMRGEALVLYRLILGHDNPETILCINSLADIMQTEGKFAEAEPLHREALERSRRVLGDDHPNTFVPMLGLAAVLRAQGKLAEAEALLREVLERSRRVVGEAHAATLAATDSLSDLLELQGNGMEAESLCRESVRHLTLAVGADHPHTLTALRNLVVRLVKNRNFVEAESLCRQLIEQNRRVRGDNNEYTIKSLGSLGMVLAMQGKLAEAEPVCREAVDRCTSVLGADHSYTLQSMSDLAYVLTHAGRVLEAEPLYREILERRRRVFADRDVKALDTLASFGLLLGKQGRYAEAEPILAELYRKAPEAETSEARRALFRALYGPCLVKLGRHADAAEPLRIAYEEVEAAKARRHPLFKALLESLVEVAHATGHPDEAARWRAELADLQAATRPATPPSTMP